MHEAHLELDMLRCPRCAGQLVLRVLADERGHSVMVTLDSACIACGVSPWSEPDQRTVLFTPGVSIESDQAALAAAQARIDALLRRCETMESSLAAAQRNLARARQGDVEAALREEISHLEGQLADARAEVRRSEEATRGVVEPGKRPIEVE